MIYKVYITDKQNDIKIPSGTRILIRRCCRAVLKNEEFAGNAEIGVTLVDNEEITRLNAEFRGKNEKTDVLSFPLGEDGKYDINKDTDAAMLGDIVISLPRANEQAQMYDHTLQREIAFLTVHGMYHLLGYDHEQGGLAATNMREKEEFTLTQLGLPRTTAFQTEL